MKTEKVMIYVVGFSKLVSTNFFYLVVMSFLFAMFIIIFVIFSINMKF